MFTACLTIQAPPRVARGGDRRAATLGAARRAQLRLAHVLAAAQDGRDDEVPRRAARARRADHAEQLRGDGGGARPGGPPAAVADCAARAARAAARALARVLARWDGGRARHGAERGARRGGRRRPRRRELVLCAQRRAARDADAPARAGPAGGCAPPPPPLRPVISSLLSRLSPLVSPSGAFISPLLASPLSCLLPSHLPLISRLTTCRRLQSRCGRDTSGCDPRRRRSRRR